MTFRNDNHTRTSDWPVSTLFIRGGLATSSNSFSPVISFSMCINRRLGRAFRKGGRTAKRRTSLAIVHDLGDEEILVIPGMRLVASRSLYIDE